MSRILVGDDNEPMRRLIVELLVAEGHAVTEAADTGAVLEQVSRARPDLLVLDVHMPGGGGIAALREIRSDPASRAGADAQLPKPFRVDEFREAVGSLLAA
jgi:CheY-like chemotaxis protein